ncbi:tRNA (guanosine(46)-N7)-methyltransferase TrmB [Fulvivirga sedimenti]|uniref:tRNA (guanine-N(7)-)-methyltransferase n=1 Tax=Fulvivirga sedimenti TaxID=2879465 RepID=A0A9X1KVV8_9BACT|nr:tRNA (guanosine(46)-N7)-methyltransferase TrmB [Fulvivirga sedimenti]MCA6073324.1 tRNA (guanosine(46)-N7)-methyltransferase TrmB [Fulvivirga sedimenti]
MSRSKLARFEANRHRQNIIEPGKPLFEKIKGSWNTEYFKNDNPITVELACGRGEYTVGLARLFDDQNFIGIDVKGDRIWKGSGWAIEEGLSNVAFLRTQIQYLPEFFEYGEIDNFWITFPDPRPKDRDEKRRITNGKYLDLYKSLLAADGWVNFKTDNTGLFEFTLEVLHERNDIRDFEFTRDLYHSELRPLCHEIRTRYEEKFSAQGHDIKFLRFRFAE